MSLCRGCGAPIEWIKTQAGKYMPVDQEPVVVILGAGTDKFITDEGQTIQGKALKDGDTVIRGRGSAKTTDTVAFVPHWATCPRSRDFHR